LVDKIKYHLILQLANCFLYFESLCCKAFWKKKFTVSKQACVSTERGKIRLKNKNMANFFVYCKLRILPAVGQNKYSDYLLLYYNTKETVHKSCQSVKNQNN